MGMWQRKSVCQEWISAHVLPAQVQGNQEKEFLLYHYICRAGAFAAEETIAGLRGYLSCLPGAKEKGIIYGTGTWEEGDVYRYPSFDKAYAMGRG